MATIAENLQTIIDIKQDIKTAIENKGVDMTNTPFTEYSTKIDEISSESIFETINITQNGIYTPTDGIDGYNEIYVNITTPTEVLMFPNGVKLAYTKTNEIPNVFDFSNVTDMSSMFAYSAYLQTIPPINTSNVIDMGWMFDTCRRLTSISQIDTSKVNNMKYMFHSCNNLTTIPPLDTGNVTNMERMFYDCYSLQSIPNLNTSNVTNMDDMFYNCSKLQSIPLLECGNVTNMSTIFGYSNLNKLTNLGGFKDLKISVTYKFLDLLPNLTTESLMNVINNLYDLTANGLDGQSLSFGQTNLNKLNPEQIAVATAKGWTLT